MDTPTSSPYSKTTPKGELNSLRNIVAQGNFSNGDHSAFSWALDDTGLLTINGKGFMPSFNTSDYYGAIQYGSSAPWMDCRKKIKSVRIQEGITAISHCAFNFCVNLTDIHIPDSVTYIGLYAFNNCHSLINIQLPDTITDICVGAFQHCRALRKIRIPNSVKSLSLDTFVDTGLTHVIMPRRFNKLFGFNDQYGFSKSIVTFY